MADPGPLARELSDHHYAASAGPQAARTNVLGLPVPAATNLNPDHWQPNGPTEPPAGRSQGRVFRPGPSECPTVGNVLWPLDSAHGTASRAKHVDVPAVSFVFPIFTFQNTCTRQKGLCSIQ